MALDYIIRYAGRRIHGIDLGDAIAGGTCDLEAGAIGSLVFDLPPTHPMAHPSAFRVEDPTCEVTLHDGETELFRGWVKKATLGTDLTLSVECEGTLAYLKRTIVRPYACTPGTDYPTGTVLITEDPFDWLVRQHNLHCGQDMMFTVGVNPHVGKVRASTDWNNTWDEMNDAFCTGLDRYLNVRSGPYGQRYIDLLDGGSGEGTQEVVLGRNIVDIELSNESSEVVTAIIPRGSTDDTYNEATGERIERTEFGVEEMDGRTLPLDNSLLVIEGDRALNQTMVDVYGVREEKRDYEATTRDELLRMVAADLNPANALERSVNSINVNAIDLHAMNPSVQPIRLLEWTRVFIRAYGLEDDEAEYGVTEGGRLILDEWLPCTQIHIDLTDPAQTTYRFGDLPQTFTRKSALRLGMLRRGNGALVRRTDGVPWDNDRIWDKAQDAYDHADEVGDELGEEFRDALGELGETTEAWSKHLEDQFDAATKAWYESLDEAQKEDAQGREELLRQLDALEGKVTSTNSEIDSLNGQVSGTRTELLAGIRDVAQNAQRTFFGICETGASTIAKTVTSGNLTRPGNEAFALAQGVVIDVLFRYADTSGTPTLNIASTGARRIYAYGSNQGIWKAGQVMRFVYDGSVWQCCNTPLYGTPLVVGNPAQGNLYSDGNNLAMRIGTADYMLANATGLRVGLSNTYYVKVGSGSVDFMNGSYEVMSVGQSGGATITSPNGLHLRGYNAVATLDLGQALSTLGLGDHNFGITINGYQTDGRPWVMRSIVVSVSNTDRVAVAASRLGLVDAAGYAFAITNGDVSVQDVAVTGAAYNPTTKGITVMFSGTVYNLIRLNILGVPVGQVLTTNDPGEPGPEIFDSEGEGDRNAS